MAKRKMYNTDHCEQHAGEPADARDGLGRAFLASLTGDYTRHGKRTLKKLRRYRPHDYFKLIATFLPKKFPADALNLDDMSDEELAKALAEVRAVIAEQEKEEKRDYSDSA